MELSVALSAAADAGAVAVASMSLAALSSDQLLAWRSLHIAHDGPHAVALQPPQPACAWHGAWALGDDVASVTLGGTSGLTGQAVRLALSLPPGQRQRPTLRATCGADALALESLTLEWALTAAEAAATDKADAPRTGLALAAAVELTWS